MYQADVGRFPNVDPWAEKYSYQSPYLYAYNNPIRYTDYLGLGADDEVKLTSEVVSTYSIGENSVTVETTNIQTGERTIQRGALTDNITETIIITNTYTVSVNEDGTLSETSTQSVSSTRETTTTFESREEGTIQVGETKVEEDIYGADGTQNISLSDQEPTVRITGRAIKFALQEDPNARGIGFVLNDRQANIAAGVMGAIGLSGYWSGTIAIERGYSGFKKRIEMSENNFAGETLIIDKYKEVNGKRIYPPTRD